MRSLSTLKNKEKGLILEIRDDELSAKLYEMGLYPGKTVKILFRAPTGDPIAIDVEGYTLSLRLNEASLIVVE